MSVKCLSCLALILSCATTILSQDTGLLMTASAAKSGRYNAPRRSRPFFVGRQIFGCICTARGVQLLLLLLLDALLLLLLPMCLSSISLA